MAVGILDVSVDTQFTPVWTGDVQAQCFCFKIARISCHPASYPGFRVSWTNVDGSGAFSDIIHPGNSNSHYNELTSSYTFGGTRRVVEVATAFDIPAFTPNDEIHKLKACLWIALSQGSSCSVACNSVSNDLVKIYTT